MAHLSNSNQDPAEEDTPPEAGNAATPDDATGLERRGSVGWSVAITFAGWVLLSPAALVYGGFWLLGVAMGSGGGTVSGLTLLMVASAVGAPILLGFAFHRRSVTLWILGALASVPAIIGGIYVVTA